MRAAQGTAWGRSGSPLPQGGGLVVDGHDGVPEGWLAVGGAAREMITLRRCSEWTCRQPCLGPGPFAMCGINILQGFL